MSAGGDGKIRGENQAEHVGGARDRIRDCGAACGSDGGDDEISEICFAVRLTEKKRGVAAAAKRAERKKIGNFT